jgi:hypothetical protein
MGMEWVFVNNGPVTGFAPPGSIGLDTATPQIQITGSNGVWTGASGLAGVGAILTAAATIAPTNAVHHVTGATAISTITPPSGLAKGSKLTLIPDAASGQSTTTGGNIALGTTMVQNKALILTWDGTSWYPSY